MIVMLFLSYVFYFLYDRNDLLQFGFYVRQTLIVIDLFLYFLYLVKYAESRSRFIKIYCIEMSWFIVFNIFGVGFCYMILVLFLVYF